MRECSQIMSHDGAYLCLQLTMEVYRMRSRHSLLSWYLEHIARSDDKIDEAVVPCVVGIWIQECKPLSRMFLRALTLCERQYPLRHLELH